MAFEVPKHIQNKMHRLAKLTHRAALLSREIDNYFTEKGWGVDLMRCGDGRSLEELEYGNDVTDYIIEDLFIHEENYKKR